MQAKSIRQKVYENRERAVSYVPNNKSLQGSKHARHERGGWVFLPSRAAALLLKSEADYSESIQALGAYRPSIRIIMPSV